MRVQAMANLLIKSDLYNYCLIFVIKLSNIIYLLIAHLNYYNLYRNLQKCSTSPVFISQDIVEPARGGDVSASCKLPIQLRFLKLHILLIQASSIIFNSKTTTNLRFLETGLKFIYRFLHAAILICVLIIRTVKNHRATSIIFISYWRNLSSNLSCHKSIANYANIHQWVSKILSANI